MCCNITSQLIGPYYREFGGISVLSVFPHVETHENLTTTQVLSSFTFFFPTKWIIYFYKNTLCLFTKWNYYILCCLKAVQAHNKPEENLTNKAIDVEINARGIQ